MNHNRIRSLLFEDLCKFTISNGGKCAYCGIKVILEYGTNIPERANIDHKTPPWRGGSETDPQNFILSCARCNNYKASMTYEEYMKFRHRPILMSALKRILNKHRDNIVINSKKKNVCAQISDISVLDHHYQYKTEEELKLYVRSDRYRYKINFALRKYKESCDYFINKNVPLPENLRLFNFSRCSRDIVDFVLNELKEYPIQLSD